LGVEGHWFRVPGQLSAPTALTSTSNSLFVPGLHLITICLSWVGWNASGLLCGFAGARSLFPKLKSLIAEKTATPASTKVATITPTIVIFVFVVFIIF